MMVKLRRLWIQLTADRKRFGALSVLLVLGLLLWARIIVISNLPRTAVADPDRPGSSATATTNGGGSDSAARRRLTVVLAALAVHDVEAAQPYQAYISTVTGVDVDATDVGGLAHALRHWVTSDSGGMKWAKNIGSFLVTLLVFLVLSRIAAAVVLVHAELTDDPESRRSVEWFLAYRPWRGDEEAVAYIEALEAGEVPQLTLPGLPRYEEIEDYAELRDAARFGRAAVAQSLGIETNPRAIAAIKEDAQDREEEEQDAKAT